MGTVSDRLSKGVHTARELTEGLRISPPTLMRHLRREGDAILRIGRARASRYGRIEAWPGLSVARFPTLRVDELGAVGAEGELVTLASRQSAWLPEGAVFDGLPPEIADKKPAGGLSDHVGLLAMSRAGEDLPGNLIVGQESIDRWTASRLRAVTPEQYPDIADEVSRESAQCPERHRTKFAAYADGRHVVVKFAYAGSEDPAARLRADILALEALALDVLQEHGVPAARGQLFSSTTCRFLEVERFDRVGERGRRATITLAALHDNPTDSWSCAALRLLDAGRISDADVRRVRLLDAFGALIGNVDRHHRHVAFFPQFKQDRDATPFGFVLAPTFGQRPSLRDFIMPAPSADVSDIWEEARAIALAFWRHAEESPALSDETRASAARHAGLIGASA